MDKISVSLKKIFNHPFLIALGTNIVVLVLCIALGSGKFNSLDDYFMSSVLTGAYGGEYNVRMYFINVVYGYFLRPLYVLFPTVGWYSFFQTFTVLASFTALSYVALKRYGNKFGGMLAVMLLCCVSPDFYLGIAFTQVAGIATTAGIFLFAVGNIERKRAYLIAGCLFMVAGVIFRKDMFLLGLPTLAVLLFFSFLQAKSVWKVTIIALAAFAVAYVGLIKFNEYHFKGEYEYYAAYQGPRAYFGDGAFYEANAFVAELNDRGMNGRDFRYLRAWYFYDNHVFSLDSMKALTKIADRNRYKANYIKMPFAIIRSISDSLSHGSVWCWAILCLALMFFSNKRNWWVPWASLVLISIPYTYLLLVNRVVAHVEVGVWTLAIIFVLFFVNKNDILEKRHTKSFLQIIGLVCLSSLIITGTYAAFNKIPHSSRDTQGSVSDWLAFRSYANNHPNDVFLLPFSRYKELATHINQAYTAVEPGSWNNIYSTGYWNIHLPEMNRELEKRGVTNIIRDVWHDNVYVVADEQALSLVPYYSDHYHKKLTIDTLMHFGALDLLKYKMEEGKDENAQH